MDTRIILNILNFLHFSERLKTELRHSWLSNGRQESVAEHSWHISLLALLLFRHINHSVNLEKVLKMALIHDLVEAEVGDIPVFATGSRMKNKMQLERQAITHIRHMFLSEEIGRELYDIWHEFENAETNEAKFVKALDNLEVQIQHNMANLDTWEDIEYELVYTKMNKFCDYDPFLQKFCNEVKLQSEKKMLAGGIDIALIKEKIKSKSPSDL